VRRSLSKVAQGQQSRCRTLLGLWKVRQLLSRRTFAPTFQVAERRFWEGRHHALKSRASGFCYVADIVLAILELLRRPSGALKSKFTRILYLDLDVHHGDGVAHAFRSSASVLTLSVHFHSPGFIPLSGALEDTGPPSPSSAAYHNLNLALVHGASDDTLSRLFKSCIEPVKQAYAPDAVVIQCGSDGTIP
jgi:acetoin utilization deacetylase AcuC-like enzyme